jgi:hypothetical protein
MILAWHGSGVCDGGHSADVMNGKMDGVGAVVEAARLKLIVTMFLV